MNINCEDRERIFLDGSPEEWAELEQHAQSCAVCGEELRAWKALSVAAAELREYKDDPALWTRIEASLSEQAAVRAKRNPWREFLGSWRLPPLLWQTALAGALVVALALSGALLYTHRHSTGNPGTDRLLQSSALGEVERAEVAYAKAIEKLEADAKPQLDNSNLSLMASYREKLLVLDSAIDELRLQAGQNPSNAHLRHQLLAMYQEKQETLQEVLETKP
jgi:hypothetical protein